MRVVDDMIGLSMAVVVVVACEFTFEYKFEVIVLLSLVVLFVSFEWTINLDVLTLVVDIFLSTANGCPFVATFPLPLTFYHHIHVTRVFRDKFMIHKTRLVFIFWQTMNNFFYDDVSHHYF